MSFMSFMDSLLDENSDNSLEKKLNQALDHVEAAVGGALDKAETGIKKLDNVGQVADNLATQAETIIDKTDQATKHIRVE